MDKRLVEILRCFRHGFPCPICDDARLYWDENSQDVESCDDCDLLENFLEQEIGHKCDVKIAQLFRSPNTGKLDDIPF